MSKRYTVDETWELCLKMWKWISRQCKGRSEGWCRKNVDLLKRQWLVTNGFTVGDIENDCFFCEYATSGLDSCRSCPTKAIERNSHCMNSENHFEIIPRKFYAELRRLNKIRLTRLESNK